MSFNKNFHHPKTFPKDLKAKYKFRSKTSWWTPLWNGLLTDKHYKGMRSSLWLYLYFVVHANRFSGTLFRKTSTIANDMGLPPRTVGRWLQILKTNGYVEIRRTGHSVEITITKWKSIVKK